MVESFWPRCVKVDCGFAGSAKYIEWSIVFILDGPLIIRDIQAVNSRPRSLFPFLTISSLHHNSFSFYFLHFSSESCIEFIIIFQTVTWPVGYPKSVSPRGLLYCKSFLNILNPCKFSFWNKGRINERKSSQFDQGRHLFSFLKRREFVGITFQSDFSYVTSSFVY